MKFKDQDWPSQKTGKARVNNTMTDQDSKNTEKGPKYL
jgi:hypothetical protein